jgi:tRNA pseudouridine55 synthase
MSAKQRDGEAVAGILVVDKPQGITSFDVLRRLGRIYGHRQMGHCGTLDPMATGVLVVCMGWATRLVMWLTADDKAYTGTFRLGVTTASDDAEGQTLTEAPVSEGLCLADIQRAADRYVGAIQQIPPSVSAIHVDGKRAHERVRAGEILVMEPREVEVRNFQILAWTSPDAEFAADVSKGTYIRSLARDLGADLGCGAHLTALRRTRSGTFSLDHAVTLEQLESMSEIERSQALLSPWDGLSMMPELETSPDERQRLLHGKVLIPQPSLGLSPGVYRTRSDDGSLFGLIALAETEEGLRIRVERLRPGTST